MEEKSFTNNSILKGATIDDLYKAIDTIKSAIFYPANELGGENQFEIVCTKIAYGRVLKYLENEFSMDTIPNVAFRQKTFRGNKVFDLIKYLDFEIQQCNYAINKLSPFKTEMNTFDSVLNNYTIQLEVYKEIRELVEDGIIKNSRNRGLFFEIWVRDLFKKIINDDLM